MLVESVNDSEGIVPVKVWNAADGQPVPEQPTPSFSSQYKALNRLLVPP